jgi:hypothetical protein
MKVLWIVGVCCLIHILVCAPAVAKEEISSKYSPSNLSYFEPVSPQERPVHRPAGCGNDGTRNDSYIRDFERGNVTVIPTYDDAKLLSLNLIFKYWEKGWLKISPEKFELHALPDEKIFTPKQFYQGATSTIPDDLFEKVYLEEVYLEFSVQPKDVKHIAVVFPEGTVNGNRWALKVPPVLFDYVGQSAGGSKPKVSPCLYSTEPPSRLDAAQLRSPPPVIPLKPEQLTGTWIADAAATERNLKATSSLSEEEFGWVVGTAGMMFGLVYEIGDGTIKIGTYDGDNKLIYRLTPEQKDRSKLVYKAEKTQDAGDEFLTVVAAAGGNIMVTSQNPARQT